MSYTVRRHVIFATASGLDYCRVSEGDNDFPRGKLVMGDFGYERDPATDQELTAWAETTARNLPRNVGPGSYRIEVW